jgi:chemotaxis protein methyltransferase CheR
MIEIEDYCRLIEAESGLVFTGKRQLYLTRALLQRMSATGVKGEQDYYTLLANPVSGGRELSQLVSLVAVHETSFFRHSQQFDALRHFLLTRAARHKETGGEDSIKIWSACCSTGEEPYSIAMLAADLKDSLEGLSVKIYATDIDRQVVARARRGRYRIKSIAKLPSKYRKYLMIDKTFAQLKKELLDMTNFSELNLIKSPFPNTTLCDLDVIFCRNTFIYFNSESIRRVLKKFKLCLKSEGYLVLAPAELGMAESEGFVPAKVGKTFFYKRADPQPRNPPADEETEEFHYVPPPERELTYKDSTLGDMTYDRADEPPCPAPDLSPEELEAALRQAKQFADTGLYDKTIAICHSILCRSSSHPETYFILGLAHCEKSEIDEAVKNFTKAIYLEPRFALAQFYLGNIYWHTDRPSKTLSLYKNVIDSMDHEPYCGILPEIMDLTPPEEVRRMCNEFVSAYLGEG